MPLVITKLNDEETWRQCVARYAAKFDLEDEVLRDFDTEVRAGTPENQAAWNACYEWDVLEYTTEGED
jgi:hypothetical protein